MAATAASLLVTCSGCGYAMAVPIVARRRDGLRVAVEPREGFFALHARTCPGLT